MNYYRFRGWSKLAEVAAVYSAAIMRHPATLHTCPVSTKANQTRPPFSLFQTKRINPAIIVRSAFVFTGV